MAARGDSRRARLSILAVVVVALFGALLARLYYLQVLDETDFVEVAQQNSTRTIWEQAPRGQIFDRNGKVIVANRPSVDVTIDRFLFTTAVPDPDEQRAILLQLAQEISSTGRLTKVAELESQLFDDKYGAFDVIPVARDVTEEFQILLAERSGQFPGVSTTTTSVRTYPYGDLAAHMLGYVGPLNQEDLEKVATKEKTYQPNDEIGRGGVERVYEDALRGHSGQRVIEIDSELNPIDTIANDPGVAGSDLQLTIDIDLQALVEKELEKALVNARRPAEFFDEPPFTAPAGAAVVLDPRNGDVLAMASYPTYDPQLFVDGISQEEFDALQSEDAHTPLLNRAIQGLYPPGSTFKPFTAYAAMNVGMLGPRGLLGIEETYNDNGVFVVPNCVGDCDFQNARATVYGPVSLREALLVSSDVYFYQLAYWFDTSLEFRPAQIAEGAEIFGFGQSTNIPLPGERAGLLPTPQLKAQRHEENPEAFPYGDWFVADTINTSIGQGDIGVTPLQLANAYAMLANGGTLYSPNIAEAILDPVTEEVEQEFGPRVQSVIYLPDRMLDPLTDGLVRAVSGSHGDHSGTAVRAFNDVEFPTDAWPVAGKTGTSEKDDQADFALFAAYGPLPEPEYVVAVVLEEAGFGGDHAAPVAATILKAIQSNTVPPAQTVIEEQLAGLEGAEDGEGDVEQAADQVDGQG